jgi:Domain of unknown function (DUF5060)/Domain of unknown function (DUF5605)/Protein of unknown function (DUF4038)
MMWYNQLVRFARRKSVATFSKNDAGWSSPVAREAHNLEVVGSNPAPATQTALALAPRPFLFTWPGRLFWIILAFCISTFVVPASAAPAKVEQWDTFELSLPGPSDNNPFVDVSLSATFKLDEKAIEVPGFYDGDGIYRIRFMAPDQGVWKFTTKSNRPELNDKLGQFEATKPSAANHGPVSVRNRYHFGYADGTPFFPLGTTAYAWTHQGDALEETTLHTLANAPFNKIRMCVFPKSYSYNRNEPVYYPFEGTPPRQWDFTRFNPAFFQHLEKRIGQLRDLGIESDVILFHPYDRWGFANLGADNDDRYLRYVVARLSAYRNVWWSLANEFDLIKTKHTSDWDRLFQIIQAEDPAGHLRSIHNCVEFYDHGKPWITHVSMQNGSAVENSGAAELYRDVWQKPIVYDEVKYEGDIPQRWGNLSAEEMVHRFWEGLIAGTYVSHGETYLHPEDDVLWWSRGGVLRGQSPPRLAFLKKIMESGPPEGFEPIDKWQDSHAGGKPKEYYLIYFSKAAPTEWPFELPRSGGLGDGMKFQVDVIDTWNMTITPQPGIFTTRKKDNYTCEDENQRTIKLPAQPWMVIRARRVKD